MALIEHGISEDFVMYPNGVFFVVFALIGAFSFDNTERIVGPQ